MRQNKVSMTIKGEIALYLVASQKAASKQVQQASHAHTQKNPQNNLLLFKLQQGV